jgi:hypothetical protein
VSEQPQAVLLDSNVYFRLACSIRPLLKGSFGDAPRYTMFVLAPWTRNIARTSACSISFGG